MLTINPIKQRDWLILLLILFVAGLLRVGQPGVVEFFHDDAMLSTLAQRMVAGEIFPVTGINSSVGIPNPPTSVYVLAIPFALDSDPMTAVLFIMGLNVLGVGLLWGIAQRYFGRTVALIAGLSYALNPWAILYSRKIWAQDYHTPFVLLGLFLGLYGFWEAKPRRERERRTLLDRHEWAQALTLPVLLFGFQIHFAAWALLPLYVVLLVIGRKRISWRALTVTVLLSLLVVLPYLVGFWQTYQRNPGQVRPGAVSTLADEGQAFSTQSLEYLGYLATGFGMETWIAPEQQHEMLAAVPPVPLWWLVGVAILLGTALLLRKPYRRFVPLLWLWAYLPALALVPQWAGVYPHYFIASIPALMLLAGMGIAELVRLVPQKQALGRSILLTAYAVILLTQAMYWRGVLRYIDQTDLVYPGLTVPLHYLHEVENTLSQYDDVVVLSDGMAWDLHHESAVWPVLLRDTTRCVRTLIGDGYAVFPAGEFAALQAPNMPDNALDGLYLTDEPLHFPERPGGEGYTVHHWDSAPQWQGAAITSIEPVRYEGDVWLTGYHLSEDLLLLEWELPAAHPGLDYQYSGHFYNAAGEKLGQQDTTFWHGRHWCAGDRLLTWTYPDVPDATAALHVFLYRLGNANEPRYINAQVLDAEGTPSSDHTVIPLAD